MMRPILIGFGVAALLAAGCGPDDRGHHLPDGPGGPSVQLVVIPADDMVTIVDGVAQMKDYQVHEIVEGVETDVTGQAVLQIDSSFGAFTGSTVSVSGMAAGPATITATLDSVTGTGKLTVFVKKHVTDPSAPPGAQGMFDGATENPALAPTIIYPSPHILVPPNLGSFDVHWAGDSGAQDNLYEVKLTNQYVDVRLYTAGTAGGGGVWTQFASDSWYPIASSREQLALTVAGLNTAAPSMKGTAAAQTVDVTNEDSKGGIYYWTTSGPPQIVRYDIAKPDVPPAPYFTTAPSGCMGCHALSRDGTKIALTLDGAEGGRGTVWDVGSQMPEYSITGAPQWDFVTFNKDATKVITIEQDGHMFLRQSNSTMISASEVPPLVSGNRTTQVEMSPDGTKLVAVEFACGADYDACDGNIVVRSFDDASNTFGTPSVLVADDAVNGLHNFFPSWSPDGQWIVFTRTNGNDYADASAEIWVIKSDGTGQPIRLGIANADPATGIDNSWARWVPFGQSFGPTSEPLFYLTFSSRRPYGVRIPSGGLFQIWMTPFFPDRAVAGMDPTGAAFRVPFQDVGTSNHIAQWTEQIVVISKTGQTQPKQLPSAPAATGSTGAMQAERPYVHKRGARLTPSTMLRH